MQDEFDIQKLISTYSQNGSLGNWDETVSTYLPDGVWEIPHLGLRFEGHDGIRGALTSFFAGMDYVVQMNSPALIEVNGDTAWARSLIREAGKTKGKDEGFEYFGTYVDDIVRTADGWKFRKRSFEGLGTSMTPLLPAAQG